MGKKNEQLTAKEVKKAEILNAVRNDLIAQNKKGLLSIKQIRASIDINKTVLAIISDHMSKEGIKFVDPSEMQ